MDEFKSLKDEYPELAKQWHPIKNGELTPEQVTAGSNKIVWWKRSYDAPETGRHYDFEWKARIADRALGGTGCPYLSGKAVCPGYNDLATTNPELASEWHPEKNGSLTPEQVTAGCNRKVWWKLPYDDPKTGLHHDFEWKATIANRALGGRGCPYLSGQAVWKGYNDLATTHPALASQWHPEKNGNLTPDQVSAGSGREVWWKLPYDDPKTGRHFDFEWKAAIVNRALGGRGCPYLSGHAVWKGYNDLATTHPVLASQWHPEKNGNLTPDQVSAGSNKVVRWKLAYDDPKTGLHHDFEWKATIVNRALRGKGCPYLSGQAVWKGYNDLATQAPEIAADLHRIKNHSITADRIHIASCRKYWWKCSKCGHEWRALVINRTVHGTGCPNCCRKKEYF